MLNEQLKQATKELNQDLIDVAYYAWIRNVKKLSQDFYSNLSLQKRLLLYKEFKYQYPKRAIMEDFSQEYITDLLFKYDIKP